MESQRFRETVRFSGARKMIGKPYCAPSSRRRKKPMDFQWFSYDFNANPRGRTAGQFCTSSLLQMANDENL